MPVTHNYTHAPFISTSTKGTTSTAAIKRSREVQPYVVHLKLLHWCGYTDLFLDELKQLGDSNQR